MRIDRNVKGQFAPGASGNPSGRPRKVAAEPKDQAQYFADALDELVPFVNAKGKVEKVPAAEAYARQLVRSIGDMTPKEQLAAWRCLDKLGVLSERRERAKEPPLIREQMADRVRARLAEYERKQKEEQGDASAL